MDGIVFPACQLILYVNRTRLKSDRALSRIRIMSIAPPELLSRTTKQAYMPANNKIRTLIVDDQQFQRDVMARLLQNESDFEIVGTATNGREAVDAINSLHPDLVFLDVQMPELDGFGVVSQMQPPNKPEIIFVTANEEFAMRASDVHALDFLLKSCSQERFQAALQRARDQIKQVGGAEE